MLAVIKNRSLDPAVKFTNNVSVTLGNCPSRQDITLLVVKGLINNITAHDFEEKFHQIMGRNHFKLIVDLKELEYMNAAGWGIFIGEIKRLRGQKGDLVLAGMNLEVSELFERLDFDILLKSFPNVELAVEKGFWK